MLGLVPTSAWYPVLLVCICVHVCVHVCTLQDAFETTLEILRMMQKHPGVPHDQYESIDPEFKSFMECRDLDTNTDTGSPIQNSNNATSSAQGASEGASGGEQGGDSRLCSVSKWDGQPCEECLNKWKRAVPGGAICCEHTDNLAACPRLWA